MKLSCLPVSFFSEIISGRMSLGAWARLGAAVGLDGIDLSILFVPDHSPAAVAIARDEIESAGIGVTMVTSYPDFTHPDPAQRRVELEKEIEVVDVARRLGARFVRVTAGQAHPQTSRKEGVAWAAEGLTRLQQAVDDGVTLVYENHAKPGVWEYTDFCQPPEVFLEIVERTAACGLRINFDVGNAATYAENSVALLEQVIDRVETIHAADSAQRGKLQHVLLGTGVTPYPALFACLQSHGWDGWICMEEGSNQGPAGVEAAAAYIHKVWDSVAVAAP